MSVRVVARIRPLLEAEAQRDIIVNAANAASDTADKRTIVRIPNPKNEAELFSFQFNNVYGQDATQAHVFDSEVSPTVKHLFKGFDITLFAYGVTGTGKTHTMRGGKSLADRGMIPRLLSSIYRRARKVEKDSDGETHVEVAMSYYEIYNDKVFDLFEPVEKRTMAGLPIRDNNGKSVVCGLTERPCTTLKEFEVLYDQANINRSTSSTKLNAHSSRSHAILCVKVTQFTGEEVRISTASAIDLAGSEDNRRTDNNKDRLIESASINKSLFVLAQCVEAISKKQARIPYRESKMTRILSLGQNNGLTVMILNLAPVRSYHLDTLSSLNFANRTKKIEVNEIENQPFFRGTQDKKLDAPKTSSLSAAALANRQPLRSKILSQSSSLREMSTNATKPAKSFAVYSDKSRLSRAGNGANSGQHRPVPDHNRLSKRRSNELDSLLGRPSKQPRLNAIDLAVEAGMTKEAIEALVERKVNEALAERVDQTGISSSEPISGDVQKRLDALEKRVEGQESERAEGLQYLLLAKQHQVRGEDASALKMYQLALPYFPANQKLLRKLTALQDKIEGREQSRTWSPKAPARVSPLIKDAEPILVPQQNRKYKVKAIDDDSDYEPQKGPDCYDNEDDNGDEFIYRPRTKIRRPVNTKLSRSAVDAATAPISWRQQLSPDNRCKHPPYEQNNYDSEDEMTSALESQTPRTRYLLDTINTKDVSQIKLLKGVGAKRAEAIVNSICDLDDEDGSTRITSLRQLGKLKGVGVKTMENMRNGVVV